MRKYGDKYIVLEQVTRHADYEPCPQSRVDIYGIYLSLSNARKGLADCAKIAEKVYRFDCLDEDTAVVRIVDEDDVVVIMKHSVSKRDGEIYHNSELISIRIEREV